MAMSIIMFPSVITNSVVVETELVPMKNVPLEVQSFVTGEPAEGYELTAIELAEETVPVAARQELLDAFEGLIRAHRGQIIESNISREEDDICLEVVAKLPEPITHDEAIAFMKAHSDVTRISV